VKVEEVLQKLERCSPLVFAGEVRTLQEELAKASLGQGFVLMGGDCAETFKEFNVNHVRDTFRVILQMALVMAYGAAVPVVKIGRMAGQFAKPRSEPDEVIDGVSLPSYRGDILNGEEFTLESRTHNPQRMLDAYHQSSQTLNILRAFAIGGYADISRLHAWNLDFVEQTPSGSRYREMCAKVDESLRFMKAIGVDTRAPTFTQCNFYTAHECLLLPYEQALTRQDSITDKWYDCSAHMLWVGERTRQIDHAHLHFLSGIGNPIGIKVSDKASPEELLELLEIINPDNIPGRVVVIVRMGAEKLRLKLPGLIRAVQREGRTVLWMSDPVHGNTIKTDNGFKTRPFDRIRDELRAFFDVHAEMGTHPGGVHLEMTGKDVTECIGGNVAEVLTDNLGNNYATGCDPRLNSNQSLELAFLIAERMRLAQGLEPLFGK
jgi:3-deoxy-7-phosphoheptulonate synthase